jgi:uncharacterized membrane protein YkoI
VDLSTSKKIGLGLGAAGVATGLALGAGSALGSGGSGDDDSPSFTSSVKAPAKADEPETTAQGESEQGETEQGETEQGEQAAENAEQKALLRLATVDAGAARTAALSTARGSVTETELENEDGNVVWKVEIRNAAGLETKVYVDAGNAKVLASETEHED